MTQTVPDISPLMPMHQDPLLVSPCGVTRPHWFLCTMVPMRPYLECSLREEWYSRRHIICPLQTRPGRDAIRSSDNDSIKEHQSSASLAFVKGIHRWLVDSPHKGPVTQKMVPFDDVITFHCNVKEIDIELTHICQHQLCINNFWYHLAHNISRKANNISRKVITPEIRHFLRHISWRCGRKTKLPSSHKLCLWMLWICFYIKYFLTLLALCEGNPLVTGGFPSQKTSNA